MRTQRKELGAFSIVPSGGGMGLRTQEPEGYIRTLLSLSILDTPRGGATERCG